MARLVLSRKLLMQITDARNERNIYVHPNPLARAIFWQRLTRLHQLMTRHVDRTARLLDLGGGSGVFAPALSASFAHVDIIDRDPQDARNIIAHFSLENVGILEQDVITEYVPQPVYDAAVAADVLEHFQEVDQPIHVLYESLKPEGHLLVSLPTENALYRIGRKIVRKQKPADHYHTAHFVISRLVAAGFVLKKSCYVPQAGVALPLFRIAVLQKPASVTTV